MKKRKPERNNFSAYRKGAEQKSSAPFLFHSHIIRKTHIEFIKHGSFNGGVITVDREKTSLNILKFILFALIFVVVGIGICTLWSFIGKLAVTGIDDVLASPEKELPVIIIDAGHGGSDLGATYQGRQEKDDTLALTLAVGRLLAEDPDIDVVYTRETDMYDTPLVKARKANAANADYFISIHRNSTPVPNTYSGVETLVYSKGTRAEMLARNIASALSAIGFADLGTTERKNLTVLKRTNMPAVIVEVGYIDTPKDNAFLDENFLAVAHAIADGIKKTVQ